MKKNKIKEIKVADFLPVSYKILREEMLVSREKREKYYQLELQKAFKILRTKASN